MLHTPLMVTKAIGQQANVSTSYVVFAPTPNPLIEALYLAAQYLFIDLSLLASGASSLPSINT